MEQNQNTPDASEKKTDRQIFYRCGTEAFFVLAGLLMLDMLLGTFWSAYGELMPVYRMGFSLLFGLGYLILSCAIRGGALTGSLMADLIFSGGMIVAAAVRLAESYFNEEMLQPGGRIFYRCFAILEILLFAAAGILNLIRLLREKKKKL